MSKAKRISDDPTFIGNGVLADLSKPYAEQPPALKKTIQLAIKDIPSTLNKLKTYPPQLSLVNGISLSFIWKLKNSELVQKGYIQVATEVMRKLHNAKQSTDIIIEFILSFAHLVEPGTYLSEVANEDTLKCIAEICKDRKYMSERDQFQLIRETLHVMGCLVRYQATNQGTLTKIVKEPYLTKMFWRFSGHMKEDVKYQVLGAHCLFCPFAGCGDISKRLLAQLKPKSFPYFVEALDLCPLLPGLICFTICQILVQHEAGAEIITPNLMHKLKRFGKSAQEGLGVQVCALLDQIMCTKKLGTLIRNEIPIILQELLLSPWANVVYYSQYLLCQFNALKEEINVGEKVCSATYCGSKEKLKKCSRCQNVQYCSRECQKLDWPLHKQFCGTDNDTGDIELVTGQQFVADHIKEISIKAAQKKISNQHRIVVANFKDPTKDKNSVLSVYGVNEFTTKCLPFEPYSEHSQITQGLQSIETQSPAILGIFMLYGRYLVFETYQFN